MNDSELDKKLAAASGPALSPDYGDDFARQVLANLHARPVKTASRRRSWFPWLAGALAFGACMLMIWVVSRERSETSHDALANLKLIQETLAMFPNRVRAIVQDEQGMKLVLSDEANVPASTPIYAQFCDGRHCSSVVTFSGQEIQIAGQSITVLADGTGGVILEGQAFAWHGVGGGNIDHRLKVQARLLEAQAL